jgi:hypothetical protein
MRTRETHKGYCGYWIQVFYCNTTLQTVHAREPGYKKRNPALGGTNFFLGGNWILKDWTPGWSLQG